MIHKFFSKHTYQNNIFLEGLLHHKAKFTEQKKVFNLLERLETGTGEMMGNILFTIEDTKRIER